MSQLRTLPGRPAPATAAPLSKVDKSRLVLSGTVAVVAFVLMLWLLIAPWLPSPSPSDRYLAAAFGLPDAAASVVAFPAEDGAGVGAVVPVRLTADAALDDLKKKLAAVEEQRPGAPLVLYLSAVGVSAEGDPAAYLVPVGGTPADRASLVPVRAVVDAIRERSRRPGKALLILDAGQAGSDRGLGVFGNGFFQALESLVSDTPGLLVMTPCAPGQLTWTAEPYRCSVFGRFVAEGLAQGGSWSGLDADGLYRDVRSRVARWARDHRGAVQTPMLLGDVKRDNFRLPRSNREVPPLARPIDPARFRELLAKPWASRHALAASAPYLHAPLPWRRYNAALLHAEQLLREGRPEEAERTLALLAELEQEVRNRLKPALVDSPWSVALLEASAAPKGLRSGFERAVRESLKPPAEGGPKPPVAPQPADADASPTSPAPTTPNQPDGPDAKPAQPKAAQGKAASKDADKKAAPKDADEKAADSGPSTDEKTAKEQSKPGEDRPPDAEPAGEKSGTPSDLSPERFLAERLLADRYEMFRNLGAETDEMRPARVALIERGTLGAATAAERAAAADERIVHWIRPLVDRGDAVRLPAQDLVFSDSTAPFRRAEAGFGDAESDYRKALEIAPRLVAAHDLLLRLEDELPYYADWLASRDEGLSGTFPAFDAALNAAARLAAALDAPPSAEGGEGVATAKVDERAAEVDRLAAEVRSELARIEADFRRSVGRATAGRADVGWRAIDSLLRVPLPALSVDDRIKLLGLVNDPALTPAPSASSPTDEDPSVEPDPAFWQQAVVLARLESGLLAIAGADVQALGDPYDKLRAAAEKGSSAPGGTEVFKATTAFSTLARTRRSELLGVAPGTPGTEPSSGSQTLEALRRERTRADRLARALPVPEVARLFLLDDPSRHLADLQRHALLVWNAQRLARDLALEPAARLVAAARAGGVDSSDLRDAAAEVDRLSGPDHLAVAIRQDGDPAAKGPRSYSVEVQGGERLPKGSGVVLLAHDPTQRPDIRPGEGGDEGALLPLPRNSDATPALRRFVVENQADLKLTPAVFYRGRVDAADRDVLALAIGELVSVEIRHRTEAPQLKLKIADQFLEHPGEGYIHPNNDLEYRLTLRNNTSKPLDLILTRRFADRPPQTDALHLEPEEVLKQPITGVVAYSDVQDGTPRALKIDVADRRGKPLSKPREVVFRPANPKDYVSVVLGYSGREFYKGHVVPVVYFFVRHEGSDKVTAPSTVYVEMQPFVAFHQMGTPPEAIRRGDVVTHKFAILDPNLEKFKWSLTVDGVRNALGDEVGLQNLQRMQVPELLQKPPPPPADGASTGP